VEVEVESTDKGGNFVGWLYVDGKNLSLLLVQVVLIIIYINNSEYEKNSATFN